MFSPNGTVADEFWPTTGGPEYELKKILQPLEKFKSIMMPVHGICNKVGGDGDGHMKGMSCLLTGVELLPGNIQGGSDTPAGWASGISIDQELKNFLQSKEATRTRFGSLEFGVGVNNRADPWTRMCYAGKNQPVEPVSDPYTMFARMYGRSKDDDLVRSVLDDVREELAKTARSVGTRGKQLLDQHVSAVRQMEQDLQAASQQTLAVPEPALEPGVNIDESNLPQISKMQIDLLVNGFANDMNRIATLQYSNSVGQVRMRWLGIDEPHHSLSHDPDMKKDSQQKLVQINRWFASQLAYLVEQLAATKEPGSDRSLLDDTIIVWGNELGKGNSHTRDNIPMLVLGNAPGFRAGRYAKLENIHHNRFWLTLAHAFGHRIDTFGIPQFCEGGVLDELA